MPALAIMNPRRRRRKARVTVKRRNPKRRRKMTAKQLKIFGPRKGKRAKGKVIIVESNPKGARMAKRKRRGRKRTRKFFGNPKRVRRYRRNPRVPGAGLFKNTMVPALIGAGGALGVDVLLGNFPLPPQFRYGPMLPITRIALALLVGAAVGAMSNSEAGEEAAAGGVIVTLYGVAKNWMVSRMPNFQMGRYVPLNGMGRQAVMVRRVNPGAGQPGMARYVPLRAASLPPAMMNRPGGGMNMRVFNPARMTRGGLRGLNG